MAPRLTRFGAAACTHAPRRGSLGAPCSGLCLRCTASGQPSSGAPAPSRSSSGQGGPIFDENGAADSSPGGPVGPRFGRVWTGRCRTSCPLHRSRRQAELCGRALLRARLVSKTTRASLPSPGGQDSVRAALSDQASDTYATDMGPLRRTVPGHGQVRPGLLHLPAARFLHHGRHARIQHHSSGVHSSTRRRSTSTRRTGAHEHASH